MGNLATRAPVLRAVRALLREQGLPDDRLEAWKDGSNLLIRPYPAPVILRAATFTGRVRRDPMPYLEREVALVGWLAPRRGPVMAPATAMPPGPYLVDGWGIAAFGFVDHVPGLIPTPVETLDALRDLNASMARYRGDLPYLGPVTDDLDRALAFAVDEDILGADRARRLAAGRDELLRRLDALDPDRMPQHGDAFPRNAVRSRDGAVTWIDLEDACRGPRAWDLAVLARNTGDAAVRKAATAAVGEEALETASALRSIQAEVWAALHEARVVRGW